MTLRPLSSFFSSNNGLVQSTTSVNWSQLIARVVASHLLLNLTTVSFLDTSEEELQNCCCGSAWIIDHFEETILKVSYET